jgi:hypothetical protein
MSTELRTSANWRTMRLAAERRRRRVVSQGAGDLAAGIG